MCSFKLQAGVRFREGEEKVVKRRAKITEREEKHEQRLNYVMTCRRLCEPPTLEEVREAEGRVGDFMQLQFPDYIPLRHHLMRFQQLNILKQHSDLTPAEELSVYNLYTGGEGQTEEQMLGILPKQPTSAALACEATDDEEDI